MARTNAGHVENKNVKTRNTMDDRQRALFLAGYNAAIAQADEVFSPPARTHNRTPKVEGEALAKAKGLTKYEIRDGVFIYAKNEREAVKRAKKRGLL